MLDARTTDSLPTPVRAVDDMPSPVAWLERLREAALVSIPADVPEGTQHLRSAVHHLRAWIAPAGDDALERELHVLIRRTRRVHRLEIALARAPSPELAQALRSSREAASEKLARRLRLDARIQRLTHALAGVQPIPVALARAEVGRLASRVSDRVRASGKHPHDSRRLRATRRAVRRLTCAVDCLREAGAELGSARDQSCCRDDLWELDRSLGEACDLALARSVAARVGGRPGALDAAGRPFLAAARLRAYAAMAERADAVDALVRRYSVDRTHHVHH